MGGSNLPYSRGGAGTCGDRAGGVTYAEDDSLCAACLRTLGTPSKHIVKETQRPLVTTWLGKCHSAGNRSSCLCATNLQAAHALGVRQNLLQSLLDTQEIECRVAIVESVWQGIHAEVVP